MSTDEYFSSSSMRSRGIDKLPPFSFCLVSSLFPQLLLLYDWVAGPAHLLVALLTCQWCCCFHALWPDPGHYTDFWKCSYILICLLCDCRSCASSISYLDRHSISGCQHQIFTVSCDCHIRDCWGKWLPLCLFSISAVQAGRHILMLTFRAKLYVAWQNECCDLFRILKYHKIAC